VAPLVFWLLRLIGVSSVTGALSSSLPIGINPFWKLSFIFKCLTDSVVLDDFKTALDRLRAFKLTRLGSFAADNGQISRPFPPHSAKGWPGSHERTKAGTPVLSPDGDELSHVRSWPSRKAELNHAEGFKGRNREMSQTGERSRDAHVAQDGGDSPILRPQCSWLRDSSEGDYAQAVREVTRSSHSEASHTEREVAIGRAR